MAPALSPSMSLYPSVNLSYFRAGSSCTVSGCLKGEIRCCKFCPLKEKLAMLGSRSKSDVSEDTTKVRTQRYARCCIPSTQRSVRGLKSGRMEALSKGLPARRVLRPHFTYPAYGTQASTPPPVPSTATAMPRSPFATSTYIRRSTSYPTRRRMRVGLRHLSGQTAKTQICYVGYLAAADEKVIRAPMER
jgi:hypothetical protein